MVNRFGGSEVGGMERRSVVEVPRERMASPGEDNAITVAGLSPVNGACKIKAIYFLMFNKSFQTHELVRFFARTEPSTNVSAFVQVARRQARGQKREPSGARKGDRRAARVLTMIFRHLGRAASLRFRISRLPRASGYSAVQPAYILQLRCLAMESTDPTNPTLKRPLEEDSAEGSSKPPKQIQKVGESEDTSSTVPGDANAEAGGSNNGSRESGRARGKNSKVPMSRRAARDARKWNDTRRGTRPERVEGEERNEEEGESSKGLRLPKRHCALLLGFCGSGYSGMQLYVIS